MSEHEATRRNVLYGAAAAGLAVPVLAACGSDDPDASGTTEPTDPTTGPGSTPDGGAPTSEAPGGIPASDIPVGGGKIFKDERIVVTQPAAGEFKAFSAVCTHQGCIVSDVEDKQIRCDSCHFSRFSITDGSVEKGPATKPLVAKTVTVNGDSLTVS